MKFTNFHTHTTFSDGAGTPRENIEAAIAKGMTAIGFSDHTQTGTDTYCMKESEYSEYVSSLRALKEEYRGKIDVLIGMEKDFYSKMPEVPLDYLIASVHYLVEGGKRYPVDHSLEQQIECINEAFGKDKIAYAERYFSMVYEHVKLTRPTFIGHYDLINKFSYMPEDDERYIKIANHYLQKCLKICKHVEFNTGGIARGTATFPYPNRKMLECILKNGGEVLLSSDSHKIENLTFYFDEAVRELKKCGFKSIVTLTSDGFKSVMI